MDIQASSSPLQTDTEVNNFYQLIEPQLNWSAVGVLIDGQEGMQHAILIVLLAQDDVISVFRLCLDTSDQTCQAVQKFIPQNNIILKFRCLQGEHFTSKDIQSLDAINQLWHKAANQSIELDETAQFALFDKLFLTQKDKGRGKDFTTQTKRQVKADAHGRCMFEGCGLQLDIDELTGQAGNYSYLAHNVAAAENGPRGIPVTSGVLSDEPNNVLLLCDKHHRLIDKVAIADYPAWRLSQMRQDFCKTATQLLNGLSYQPVPAVSLIWPVQRNFISPPSELQIAQSLAKLNWRMNAILQSPSNDNDATLRDLTPEQLQPLWPTFIETAAQKIIGGLGNNQYRCALFAFGPMPQLIALGVKLGNKQEIIPMLRYRDGNQWVWPADNPQGRCYEVLGLNELSETEDEIVLALSFTAQPSQFEVIAEHKKLKIVEVKANINVMGNGAIGHPQDGIEFMAHMQRFLHQLKDDYGVKVVHVLPCASNALCVFFGKAYDLYHPKLVLYDFDAHAVMGMKPIFQIVHESGSCKVNAITDYTWT